LAAPMVLRIDQLTSKKTGSAMVMKFDLHRHPRTDGLCNAKVENPLSHQTPTTGAGGDPWAWRTQGHATYGSFRDGNLARVRCARRAELSPSGPEHPASAVAMCLVNGEETADDFSRGSSVVASLLYA
jgi:hypothetical protein